MESLFVCHTRLVPSALHGHRPQRLSAWALGTCTSTLPTTPPQAALGGLSCRPAISIVLSAVCSALCCHLVNDDHLTILPPVEMRTLLVTVNRCTAHTGDDNSSFLWQRKFVVYNLMNPQTQDDSEQLDLQCCMQAYHSHNQPH